MKRGDYINVHLIDPVERLWGRLITLNPAGVIMRGFAVSQLETFKYQFRKKERQVFPQTMFFPMRRVQKLDMDEALDELPSVIESMVDTTGLSADEIIVLIPDSANMNPG